MGSFSSDVDENIEKTRKKAGMIFSSNSDRQKVNPLIYIKFWQQACLPSLLYGTELFTPAATLLAKLERCQQWFLKNVFYGPKFVPKQLLLKLSGLNSIESEIALRMLMFLGRLLKIRANSYFDTNIVSLGDLICETLHKCDLFNHFDSWCHDPS